MVNVLNAKVQKEGPYTFMDNVFGDKFLFNATMTRFPEFRSADNMIELHMDARFLDVSTSSVAVASNTVWQPREVYPMPQKEQVFIHESVINSFLFALSDSYMPMMLNNTLLTTQLIDLFPELKMHYG